jgi:hypothetical protein
MFSNIWTRNHLEKDKTDDDVAVLCDLPCLSNKCWLFI